MRFKLRFRLHHEILDVDYRPTLISFIKHALIQDNPTCYHALYENGTFQKSFAFAPYLSAPIFNGDIIKIPNKHLGMLFTTPDYPMYINLYNAFLKQRFNPFPLKFNNTMVLESIVMVNEPVIEKDTALIRMLSPLVVRRHDRENNQDHYLVFDHEEFESAWQDTIRPLLANVDHSGAIERLSLKPIECKKVVVRVFQQNIDTTLGIFKLTGDRALLNYLFSLGLSSRRNQGFGVFDVIG